MNTTIKSSLAFAALLAILGCDTDPAEYRFGENITGLRFEMYHESEGIHPSQVTLENERNPFRDANIGFETKFAILAEGGNAGAFYAWATLLARQPTGEHQFYTALKLADIYIAGEVDEADLETVRTMAIAGYQTVLDEFPDSVTFDATGTIAIRLATLAYKGIVALGGVVEGDWVLVTTPDGGEEAIQGGGDSRPGDE